MVGALAVPLERSAVARPPGEYSAWSSCRVIVNVCVRRMLTKVSRFVFRPGPHAFIPIPTGTPVLASRSSPYTDYTNISPVSSNDPTTVAPPTALYGTSPGNSSTAIGAGPSTHLLVPGPLQISGEDSGQVDPTSNDERTVNAAAFYWTELRLRSLRYGALPVNRSASSTQTRFR